MNVKKHFNRVKILADQTVGRAEKTDVLSGELHQVDERNESFHKAIEKCRAKLQDCLRSRSSQENFEKRRKKLPEFALQQALTGESPQQAQFEKTLLGQVMQLYSQVLGEVVNELVQSELEIEQKVLDRFQKYIDDENNIKQLKSKLKNLTLDMDSAKSRLSTASADKREQVQEELDEAMGKVESCKDTLAAEIYTLAAKEVEMASMFTLLVKTQLEYHQATAKSLGEMLPRIETEIAKWQRRPVYGTPLEDHVRYLNAPIALVIEVCCSALSEIGLKDEGLFRVSGNQSKVKKLRAAFDAFEIDLADFANDPHSIAGALKMYLRELPDCLMSHTLYTDWLEVARLDGSQRIDGVKRVLSRLPEPNYDNLRYLVKFLAKVADLQIFNKMSAANLAIVVGPNVIWSPYSGDGLKDSNWHGLLVECLISNAQYLFPGEINFNSNHIGSLINSTGGFMSNQTNGPLTVATHQSHSSRRSPEGVGLPTQERSRKDLSMPWVADQLACVHPVIWSLVDEDSSSIGLSPTPKDPRAPQRRPKSQAPLPPPYPKPAARHRPTDFHSHAELSEGVAAPLRGSEDQLTSGAGGDMYDEIGYIDGNSTTDSYYYDVSPAERSESPTAAMYSVIEKGTPRRSTPEALEEVNEQEVDLTHSAVSGFVPGHKKTGSLDRPLKPPRVSVDTNKQFDDSQRSRTLDRSQTTAPADFARKAPSKFPSDYDLSETLHAPSEAGQASGGSVKENKLPMRPPLPARDKLDKGSAPPPNQSKQPMVSVVEVTTPTSGDPPRLRQISDNNNVYESIDTKPTKGSVADRRSTFEAEGKLISMQPPPRPKPPLANKPSGAPAHNSADTADGTSATNDISFTRL